MDNVNQAPSPDDLLDGIRGNLRLILDMQERMDDLAKRLEALEARVDSIQFVRLPEVEARVDDIAEALRGHARLIAEVHNRDDFQAGLGVETEVRFTPTPEGEAVTEPENDPFRRLATAAWKALWSLQNARGLPEALKILSDALVGIPPPEEDPDAAAGPGDEFTEGTECLHEPKGMSWGGFMDTTNTCARCGKRIMRDLGPWREEP